MININMMRRQSIYFNYKKKEHITTQYPKPRESRKYFGRKLEMEKLVDEIAEEELIEFVKR